MNSVRIMFRAAVAAIAVLALAACGEIAGKIPPPPDLTSPDLVPPEAAPAPPPPPLIPLPPPQARDLLGLAADQVRLRLGPAGFSRQEQAAQVWHYKGDGCQLWVFLYEDEPGGVYRVAHVERHGRDGEEEAGLADGNRCYTSLLSATR